MLIAKEIIKKVYFCNSVLMSFDNCGECSRFNHLRARVVQYGHCFRDAYLRCLP